MGQALYRLYRPKTFNEVVGQQHITTVLLNQIKEGNPSHAYLFIGSRGTGKTTCAKLMAKAVNCLDPQEGSPCGKCQICKGVDDGSLLDVVEIDAASNNGVDDIRELREEAFFTPAVAKYRVYIIDEVHMLSPSAFNALLKILEEPPAHVIFILATTEVHKVLPTIISRCQRFDFHRIENEIIAGRLLSVAKSEDISLSPDAAELIARLSDGGMRDALSLLDVCAANSRDITAAVVANSAGLVGSEHLLEISGKILQGDTASVLRIIARLSQKSMDAQRLCEQLCGHYRNLMLVKTVAKPENLVSCLPSDIEMLREQANAMSLNDILHSMTVLQDACSRMSKSTAKRSELELALVTLCDNDAKTGYFALLSRIEKLENAMRKGAFAAAPATAVEADEPSKPVEQPKAEKKVQKEEEPYYIHPDNEKTKPSVAAQKNDILPFAKWNKTMECLAKINAPNYNMLRGTKAFFNGKQVLIDVSNPVILNMLRSNEYLKNNIKQAVFEATGERYGLGPYRPPETEKPQNDPLESMIAALPELPEIVIE